MDNKVTDNKVTRQQGDRQDNKVTDRTYPIRAQLGVRPVCHRFCFNLGFVLSVTASQIQAGQAVLVQGRMTHQTLGESGDRPLVNQVPTTAGAGATAGHRRPF